VFKHRVRNSEQEEIDVFTPKNISSSLIEHQIGRVPNLERILVKNVYLPDL